MKPPLSRDEAFKHFESWKGSRSPVLVNFGRHDGGVSFNLRMATLEVASSNLLLEVKNASMAILHFDETVVFSELTIEDVEREFSRLYPVRPSLQGVRWSKICKRGFCFIAQE